MRYNAEPRFPFSQARTWRNNVSSNSTLLVPKGLDSYLRQKRKEHGGLRRYFGYLVMVYGVNLAYFHAEPYTNFPKKRYQLSNKNYQRFDFRPDSAMWEHLRHLSFIYGPSMCWMFVHLLQLEYDRWMQAGCPENFREEAPRRPVNSSIKRNSNIDVVKTLQKIKEILQNPAPRTVLLRIMDDNHRILTKTGQIRV